MTDGRITLYIASSVDGFVADDDGGVEWLDEVGGDDDVAEGYETFLASVDCLVMGARTYEQVLDFGDWPYGGRPTFVVTSRDLPRATDAVELVDGVDGLPDRLRSEYDHAWLVGGPELARSFLRVDGVDGLRLSIVPRLLGSGVRLFGDAGETARTRLTHRETTTFESGIVELRYSVGERRAGEKGP